MGFVWLVLSALVVAAGVRARSRQREAIGAPPAKVDDAAIRAIEERGAIHVATDEPLDLEAIDEQEERFWSETWNEPSDEPEEL